VITFGSLAIALMLMATILWSPPRSGSPGHRPRTQEIALLSVAAELLLVVWFCGPTRQPPQKPYLLSGLLSGTACRADEGSPFTGGEGGRDVEVVSPFMARKSVLVSQNELCGAKLQ
jgi:hypothetical protein